MSSVPIYIFGEVLFDCFPGGEKVLGGAPFNVAWHLQAFGAEPRFISRIGADEAGREIEQAMSRWGMDGNNVQHDPTHPTGRVQVSINDGEPSYSIVPDCAYDFISRTELNGPFPAGILYHGSLCLRNPSPAEALATLISQPGMKVFLDVNLRAPWWQKQQIMAMLRSATWVKMNQDELQQLSDSGTDLPQQMASLQEKYELEQLILTRGEQGALVRTANGELHSIAPSQGASPVDTVGAGDAFSAVYIRGLQTGLPIAETLNQNQQIASRVITLRGATTTDRKFYQGMTTTGLDGNGSPR